MEMFGSVIKEQYKTSSRKIVSVAIMPCTAKKFEAARPEFKWDENQQVIDYVITTQELIQMIKEAGIVFSEIEPESIDMPFGSISGAGVIFGATGGVMEAALRSAYFLVTGKNPEADAFQSVRGLDGWKEAKFNLAGTDIRVAVASGLGNARRLMNAIRNKRSALRFCGNHVLSGRLYQWRRTAIQRR